MSAGTTAIGETAIGETAIGTATAQGGVGVLTGVAEQLGEMRMAFDRVAETTRAIPRVDRGAVARLRGPLGRLVEIGQSRDIVEQRLAHLVTAEGMMGTRSAPERAAAERVVLGQLREIARLVARESETAVVSFGTIEEQAGGFGDAIFADDEKADAAAALCADGLDAAQALARVGVALEQAVDARVAADAAVDAAAYAADAGGAGRDVGQDAGPGYAGELGWLHDLYTMEEERRVHQAVIMRGRV